MVANSIEGIPSRVGRRGKVDRRVIRTKRALFDAYERLLSDADVGRITISSLTREAGVDRKTFYLHYSSLDDMLDDMVDELVGRIMQPIMALSDDEGRKGHMDFLFDAEKFFENRAALICEEFNRVICENPASVCHLFGCSTMASLIDRFREPVIRDALAHCDLPRDRLELCATFLLGGLISCYHLWLTSNDEMDIATLNELSTGLISGGMSMYLGKRIAKLKG